MTADIIEFDKRLNCFDAVKQESLACDCGSEIFEFSKTLRGKRFNVYCAVCESIITNLRVEEV